MNVMDEGVKEGFKKTLQETARTAIFYRSMLKCWGVPENGHQSDGQQ